MLNLPITKRVILLGLCLPSFAFAQSSRPTFTRKLNEKVDWDELLRFLKKFQGQDVELTLEVPEKTQVVLPQKVDGHHAGFLLADYNLLIMANGGSIMEAGKPSTIKGIYKAGMNGTWYGYKRLVLSFLRDI